MTFCENYCRACIEREVPTSVLLHHLELMEGKPDEEKIRMKEQFAKEIRAQFPEKQRNRKTVGNP